jgi:hypothetical protein
MRDLGRAIRIDATGMRDTSRVIREREGSGRAAPGYGEAVVRLMLRETVRARPNRVVHRPLATREDAAGLAPTRPRGPVRGTTGTGPSGIRSEARDGATLAPPTRNTMR